MSTERFPLSSEQCELLMAFEAADSLQSLSDTLTRDSSVISRQLQRLAETAPVIEKQKGRWVITDLGRQINQWTRGALAVQQKLLTQENNALSSRRLPTLTERPCLVLIGVQNGFDDAGWGARNNLEAEAIIDKLLAFWREKNLPVLHIQHASVEKRSPLLRGSRGMEFKFFATPKENELVLQKSANSGFTGTGLDKILKEKNIDTLVVTGFTLNHCVDATVRSASDLGYSTYVVSDACVTFERVGPDGRHHKAHELEAASLANLSQEFTTIIHSTDLISRCLSTLRT